MTLTQARDLGVFLASIAIGFMCVDDTLGNPVARKLRGAR